MNVAKDLLLVLPQRLEVYERQVLRHIHPKAFSLKVYPELEMFAPFSPEENGIRGYPQGYGIRENALRVIMHHASLPKGMTLSPH